MTEQGTHSEQYRRVRHEFENLKIEDRAVFLVEALVTTIAHGVEEVGRVLARELDRLFRTASREAPEPPEPPAAPGSSTASEEETL